MGHFLYSVLVRNKSTTVCLLTHWTVFLKAICSWIISNGCLQNWSFRAFEILYPVLKNASERVPRSKSGASNSRPRWAEHTRIGNVWEYPPPPGVRATKCCSLAHLSGNYEVWWSYIDHYLPCQILQIVNCSSSRGRGGWFSWMAHSYSFWLGMLLESKM